MMEVKHFAIHIDNTHLPKAALKIIKNIRLDWKAEDVRFKVFTDGITNKLIGCYCLNDPDDIMLVRVYGEKTDLFIDRLVEVQNFKLMSSKGYAPKLFATFDNGMVYSYIPGDVLNVTSCKDASIYPLVATMLAKMHKLSYDSNVPKIPLVWDKCKCFIDLIPDQYSSTDKQLRFSKNFPGGKSFLKEELEELKRTLENVSNPVVFCHNDLLLANIIHRNNSVTFIDYEYAGYNYQAFDIANHFAEFAGVSEFDCTLYPSEEFQLDWLRKYLKEYSENGVSFSEERLNQLYLDVCRFFPIAHFLWSMWSLVQLHHSFIDFDYLEYAVQRFQEYKKFKKNIYYA
ncbi:ethanolamine kinase 2 [Planococcus citri]|uniref:ethanolamine kinase 2 n=1 Tax=Planococcus citri TaxID=170843 RepID=UPI0031FA37AE